MQNDSNSYSTSSRGKWGAIGYAMAILALAIPIFVFFKYASKPVWLFLALYLNLAALSIYDARSYRLPNLLNFTFFCLAGAIALLSPLYALSWHLIGAVIGFLFPVCLNWAYYKLRGRDGIGMGDAKLLGGAGLLLGWPNLPLILTIASIMGLVFALAKNFGNLRDGRQIYIPFGPFIAFATIIVWLLK